MMRLGVLTALWRRPAVSRLVLGYYADLGLATVLVAVRSPEDPEPADDVPGWEYVAAPNEPLSDKWNAGMQAMKSKSVDAVMIAGSDDMVSRALIDKASEMMRAGIDLVLFDTRHAFEPDTGSMTRLRLPRIGAGRTMSRRLLDRTKWTPWPTGHARHLDGAMDLRLKRASRPAGYQSVLLRQGSIPGAAILDIRSRNRDGTPANMWTMDALKKWRAYPVDKEEARTVLNLFPPIDLT